MHFLLSNLCRKLENYSKVYLFGTGMFAMDIYPKLCALGYKGKIGAFLVSEEPVLEFVDGVSVIKIDDLNEREFIVDDYVILIATSDKYRDEITDVLNKHGLKNKIYLSDFIKKEEELLNFYREKTEEDYYKSIFDWHVNTCYEQPDFQCDQLKKNLKNRKIRKHENQIVFVIGMETGMPKDMKLIKALKKRGYDIAVLCYADAEGFIVYDELKKNNIDIIKCGCIEELMYEMLNYNPLVYYFEPSWGNCIWADIIIQQKELFGKVIITRYDVFNDGVVHVGEEEKEQEKYALENADGVVWRWFSEQNLIKQGMQFKGKTIQFVDYCSGDLKQPKKKQVRMTDCNEIKFCYIGGNPNALFEDATDYIRTFNTVAKMEDILETILQNEDCHVHLFAWDLLDENMEKCKLLEEKYSRFKAFFGYSHNQLMDIICEYDYGLSMANGGKEVPDHMTVDGRHKGNSLKDACSNRLFDYLDAGIPIVATVPFKLCDFLEEYQVIVKMDLKNFDIDYLQEKRKFYKENVKRARKEISIDNQIGRLIQFFQDVSSAKTIKSDKIKDSGE